MMYNEFIKLTGWAEDYMSYKEYTDFIEPIYMNGSLNKREFCKALYKAHNRYVNKPVEMAIVSKGTDALVNYVEGNANILNDVEDLHSKLKKIFLNALHSITFRKENKLC